MRTRKLSKSVTNIVAYLISCETLDLLFALSFNMSFDLLEFSKLVILGFNGVDPSNLGIVINKNEEVVISHSLPIRKSPNLFQGEPKSTL
jgi:hypothetical protein